MLSPNLMLTVQFLKCLTTTVVLKKLNPRGRHRRSRRNPISSSLPRHGARKRTKSTQQIETKKTKPRADCKLAQKKWTKAIWCMNKLNDMMHVLKQWIKFNLSSNSQNWLEHRVSKKNPKKNFKTTWMFLNKSTNWSSHKLENNLEWSINQFNKPISSILTQLNKILKSSSIQALEFSIFHKAPNWSN